MRVTVIPAAELQQLRPKSAGLAGQLVPGHWVPLRLSAQTYGLGKRVAQFFWQAVRTCECLRVSPIHERQIRGTARPRSMAAAPAIYEFRNRYHISLLYCPISLLCCPILQNRCCDGRNGRSRWAGAAAQDMLLVHISRAAKPPNIRLGSRCSSTHYRAVRAANDHFGRKRHRPPTLQLCMKLAGLSLAFCTHGRAIPTFINAGHGRVRARIACS